MTPNPLSMRPSRWEPCRAILILAALTAACGNSESGDPATNVLLVTLDTTRTDAIGCYSGPAGVSPTIDDFAARGLRFEQAYTPAPLTLPAHSSLLTGRTPDEHGVRSNNVYALPEEEITLAEILSEEGYDTAAFVASYVLDSQYGLAQGFDQYGDDIDVGASDISKVAERSAEEVTNQALGWLESREEQRPFFLWIHYYDPHYPHELQAGQKARFESIYHDEVAYCDGQLARVRDALKSTGQLDHTFVVITADHGEGQLEHGETTHGYFLYQGTQHVPLILSHPTLEPGQRVADPASLIDVLPTVLGFLKLDGPGAGGVDLLAGDLKSREPIYMEAELARLDFGLSPLRGAVSGELKLIDAPLPEVYDLLQDPLESNNLAQGRSAELRELQTWLRERAKNSTSDARYSPDVQATAKIMGLGYAGTTDQAEVRREDWKQEDLARWATLLNAGLRHYQAGELDKCVQSLLPLVQECDSSFSAELYLGLALVQTTSIEEGLKHLEAAVALEPKASAEAHWNIAVAKARLQRMGDVPKHLRQAIEIDPTHLRARQKLAEIALGAGNRKEARLHLNALLTHGPDSPQGKWAKRQLKGLPGSD